MSELDIMFKAIECLSKWSRRPHQVKVVDGKECEAVEVCVGDIQHLVNILRYGERE